MKGDDGMIKNKIYAIALLAIGLITTILSKEGTFVVLASVISIPLFFSKREWIY